ncbi:hypothetical protein KPL71_008026 [Citrus sinensis]|uniref:Uncharacterized protein n=1 Tax=Citrus sinensis TaxID=2711 RepID=A0ACB8M3U4_CITSI|nr:hypothetical protein KPL71_008026 [Citrus sinensis]
MPFSSYLSKFPLCLPRLAPHGQLVKITGMGSPFLASCGSVSLESSYEKATRCIYTSTLLHENRRLGLKPVNVNKSCCQLSLAYCEVCKFFDYNLAYCEVCKFFDYNFELYTTHSINNPSCFLQFFFPCLLQTRVI